MPLSQPEMVLLDLDGTLVDTVPDLTYCLDTMLHKLSMPVAGEAKVREWVGSGIERLVKRALTNDLANNNFDRDPNRHCLKKPYLYSSTVTGKTPVS